MYELTDVKFVGWHGRNVPNVKTGSNVPWKNANRHRLCKGLHSVVLKSKRRSIKTLPYIQGIDY
jgi:hypothetical protein